MPFNIMKTEIDGLLIISPHMYEDARGLYLKYYEKNTFSSLGIEYEFNEGSDIYSKAGVLRGLHYQTEKSQAKLIHVVAGTLFDVALDLRAGSDTFGKYYSMLMKGEDHCALLIPEGFAHGFITLSENTVFSYACSGEYVPESCGGIRWDDPKLAIPWPIKEYGIERIIATEKDMNWPTLSEYTHRYIEH